MAMIVCYLKNLFRPYTAKPIKPEPKRNMLAGSGTDTTSEFAANNNLPPSANNKKSARIIIDDILIFHFLG
jgi:hypothetical protein